jgi:hypothetical protein
MRIPVTVEAATIRPNSSGEAPKSWAKRGSTGLRAIWYPKRENIPARIMIRKGLRRLAIFACAEPPEFSAPCCMPGATLVSGRPAISFSGHGGGPVKGALPTLFFSLDKKEGLH